MPPKRWNVLPRGQETVNEYFEDHTMKKKETLKTKFSELSSDDGNGLKSLGIIEDEGARIHDLIAI